MMNKQVLVVVAMVLSIFKLNEGLSFSRTIDSNMVLQRDVSASVWGFADVQGETIEVMFDGDVYSTTAFTVESGEIVWRVELEPRTAGGPYQIGLRNLDQTQEYSIDNILFGDVWFCSGQSNMEFEMFKIDNAEPDLEDSVNYPNIRIFRGSQDWADEPKLDLAEPEITWSLPNRDTVYNFSAVCFLFGRDLNSELGVPIGLIDSSWPGTPVRPWSSPDALEKCQLDEVGTDIDQLRPTTLYNAMVYPYLRTAIKGVNWYQGETDSFVSVSADIYGCRLRALIGDWGQKWNANSATGADFPFGIVQLATWRPNQVGTGFPTVRWQQTAEYGYVPNPLMPNAFMAVSLDLPDPESPYGPIHPQYKRPIATRLALAAFQVVYGVSTRGRFQGPFPTTITPAEDSLIIEYDNLQSELDIRGVNGFEVCCAAEGSTECSSWGNAPIISENNGAVTLFVDCQGQVPRILRYLWRETPCELQECAIYSVENDLPAPPFIFEL